MHKRLVIFAACIGLLPACVTAVAVDNTNIAPDNIAQERSTLESWWSFFGDDTLDKLISSAISLNSKYEVQKTLTKSNPSYNDLREFYRTPEMDLILAVTRHYIDYRYTQNKIYFLNNHIDDRDGILRIIEDSKDDLLKDTEAEQLKLLSKKQDLEAEKIKLLNELTILTNLLPEYVAQILEKKLDMPNPDIMPILASPVSVIANSPDILAATVLFSKRTNGKQYSIFPDTMVSKLFGISNDVYLGNGNIWSVSAGNATKNLDFSKVNSSRAGNDLRNNISSMITDFEHRIISYAHIEEQYNVLEQTSNNLSQEYLSVKENSSDSYISSFIKIGDKSYKANLSSLRAKYEKIRIAVDMYEDLGAN